MSSILLTGISGYLGSRLASRLFENGHEIIGIVRGTSSLGSLSLIRDKVKLYDLTETELQTIFKDKHIDIVIHLATSYGRAGESSADIAEVNTTFPHKLLECCIENHVCGFINTDTTLNKYVNAYSLAKRHFVEWAKYLLTKSDIAFVNVRLEHFYGPNDSDRKFVTYIVKQCLANAKEIPLTLGEQKRDFIYIDDVLSAYEKLIGFLSKVREGYHEFDVGSGDSVSIRKLVTMIKQYTLSETKLKFGALEYRADEVMCSKVDLAKLRRLGWSPTVELSEGLKHVIEMERV